MVVWDCAWIQKTWTKPHPAQDYRDYCSHLHNMREARTMLLQMHLSQTRVQRLCDQSHQFGEDTSTSHHTDCSYKHRKTTRNICEATSKDHTLKFLAKIVHEGWSKTVPMVFSHIGTSEMKLHVKMASCQINHATVWKKFHPQGTTYGTLCNW